MEQTVWDKLKRPFPLKDIKWRIGAVSKDGHKANMLCYTDARNVQDRLDEVIGPQNWSTKYWCNGNEKFCELSIKVGDEWICKSNAAENTKIEATKGGASDAFKRAAVEWGISRYLYNASDFNTWVDVDLSNPAETAKKNEGHLADLALQISLTAYDLDDAKELIRRIPSVEQLQRIYPYVKKRFGESTELEELFVKQKDILENA
jgi:hypothetical protein